MTFLYKQIITIKLLNRYNSHEIEIGKLAKQLGFQNVSLSHEISPMIRSVN